MRHRQSAQLEHKGTDQHRKQRNKQHCNLDRRIRGVDDGNGGRPVSFPPRQMLNVSLYYTYFLANLLLKRSWAL